MSTMTPADASTLGTAGGARLEIDRTRCHGHGVCAALAPHLIDLDEWGFPELRHAGADEPELRRLTTACPALALRLAQ